MSIASTDVNAAATGDRRLKRHLGLIGLLFTAVGSIIGSGWLFGAMYASEQAGPASIFSWIFGGVMILFIGLCYSELGTMFPLSGGVIRYPHFTHGSFASYTLGWVTWIAVASVAPVEVEAALQYAANYLPFLETLKGGVAVLTTTGFFVACALMLLFCIINFMGIRWFARINNALVWWKLGIIALVVIAFLSSAHFDGSHMTAAKFGGFAPLGWHGVFSAIATAGVVFSFFGFRQGVELAGETSNPQRNVPIAIIGSLLLCGLLYVLLQIAFIGILPDSALSEGWSHIGTALHGGLDNRALQFGPLAALAIPIGLSWLAILLYVDAFFSPADTGLIYTTLTARMSYAMARNGNAPKGLGKVNERGVPWISVILAFFVCCVFFLPFPGWQKLIGLVTAATVLSFGSGPIVMMALRRELPDHKRPFRLGGGWIIPFLAFLSSNLIVIWSGWDTIWKLMLLVVLGLILFAVQEIGWGKHTPNVELKPGLWVIVWLGGLTLLSWLSRYPEPSAHAGNLGDLGLVGVTIVTAIFSALILWLAHATRLRGDAVKDHLNDAMSWTSAE